MLILHECSGPRSVSDLYIINIIYVVLVVWRTRFKCCVHGPRDGSDARLGKRQTPAACIGEHPITSS